MARKKANGQHPAKLATDTKANTDEAEYQAAVERCKAMTANMSDKQWSLGDEAAMVTKVYGDNRLKQFALDINFPGASCTLGRYRSVCQAFPKTGGRPRFFASAHALQAHPDRIQIVTATPNISVNAAREHMRLWRAKHGTTTQADEEDQADDFEEEEDTEPTPGATPSAPAKTGKAKGTKRPVDEEHADLNESKRLLNKELELANNMIAIAEARKNTPPDQRRNLGKVAAACLGEDNAASR